MANRLDRLEVRVRGGNTEVWLYQAQARGRRKLVAVIEVPPGAKPADVINSSEAFTSLAQTRKSP